MTNDDSLVETLPYTGGKLNDTSRPVPTAVKRVAPGRGAERVDGEVYVYDAATGAMVYSPGVAWPLKAVER